MLKLALELIGTVAFSASGAVVGIRKKMDILGVATLGVITAVGGGVIRDILIGATPPNAFRDPVYALIAIGTALLVFLPGIGRRVNLDHFLWILADSIGLAAFTMIGVSAGSPDETIFLRVFLGITTGVGGGVIRDVCAGEVPMIFVKHFYACPCIIGAILCVSLYGLNPDVAIVAGFVAVLALRLLAAKFKWHLPKAK